MLWFVSNTTKAVINFKYILDSSVQEILYRIDNWINEGLGWAIESVHNKYVNISIFSPLAGGIYIKLLNNFRNQ